MIQREFDELQEGDIVESKGEHVLYIITGKNDLGNWVAEPYLGTVLVSSRAGWFLFRKGKEGESDQIHPHSQLQD